MVCQLIDKLTFPDVLTLVTATGAPIHGVVSAGCTCPCCSTVLQPRTDNVMVHERGNVLLLVPHRGLLPDAVSAATWHPVCSHNLVLAVPQQTISNAQGQALVRDLPLLATLPADHSLSRSAAQWTPSQAHSGELGKHKGSPTALQLYQGHAPGRVLLELNMLSLP